MFAVIYIGGLLLINAIALVSFVRHYRKYPPRTIEEVLFGTRKR